MEDTYRLQRFVEEQDLNNCYETAVSELRGELKVTHWMWFIFPQIAGLGHSALSTEFAIGSLKEAEAYLRHPILGPRLSNCSQILLEIEGKSAIDILGSDAIKLRSCMTLFMNAGPDAKVFRQVLDKYFDGSPDAATMTRL